jgi:CDP-diacylglycerol--glycerol-3-phosphate 3-phosphatidyltransferase
MFGPRIQHYARRVAEVIVSPLARIGMTPNMATLLGLLLNAVAAAIIAFGNLRVGGVMLLFAGLFDMVDGALARIRNQKTTFGAFLDSTLDRYSEGIVLLGVILFALSIQTSTVRTWIVVLAYIAALSSLMVSYARARAEGLGMSLKSGLMARPERVLVLGTGLIIGGESWLVWTLAFLAVTSTFTAVQRIVTVWVKLRVRLAETATSSSAAEQAPEATTEATTAASQNEATPHSPTPETAPSRNKPAGSAQFWPIALPAAGIKLVPRRFFRATGSDTVTSERSRRT